MPSCLLIAAGMVHTRSSTSAPARASSGTPAPSSMTAQQRSITGKPAAATGDGSAYLAGTPAGTAVAAVATTCPSDNADKGQSLPATLPQPRSPRTHELPGSATPSFAVAAAIPYAAPNSVALIDDHRQGH